MSLRQAATSDQVRAWCNAGVRASEARPRRSERNVEPCVPYDATVLSRAERDGFPRSPFEAGSHMFNEWRSQGTCRRHESARKRPCKAQRPVGLCGQRSAVGDEGDVRGNVQPTAGEMRQRAPRCSPKMSTAFSGYRQVPIGFVADLTGEVRTGRVAARGGRSCSSSGGCWGVSAGAEGGD